mgnify:CR=1 FL=1
MNEALLREFPHLDRMMVDTLVAAYENGTLEKYDFHEDSSEIPKHTLLKGNITVTDEKNVDVKQTQCVAI